MAADDPAFLLRLAEVNAGRGDLEAAATCVAGVLEGPTAGAPREQAARLATRLLAAPGLGAPAEARLRAALAGAGPRPAPMPDPAGDDPWARSSGTLDAVRRLLISPDVLGRLRDAMAPRSAGPGPAAAGGPTLPILDVVTRLLAADLDVEATAALAADLVARAARAERAHLFVGEDLAPVASAPAATADVRSLAAEAARRRGPADVADASRDRRFGPTLAGRALLAVPIIADGGQAIVGALVLVARPGVLDAAARGLVQELAALVAPALDKARRFEERGRALARSERLLEQERAAGSRARGPRLLGRSPAHLELERLVDRVSPGEHTVLIEGESGTGKELVARAIHARSGRAGGPFVAESLGALSGSLAEAELFGHAQGAFTGANAARPGLFQVASGGTLLLDEVGEATPELQAKLLRVLQEREVRPVGSDAPVAIDVRVLAATHRDLRREVSAGRFREDLYYRLSVVRVRVPPLRERREDVPMLIQHFVALAAAELGTHPLPVPDALLARLSAYPWPGNVRQLAAWATRFVVSNGEIDLPDEAPSPPGEPSSAAPLPGGLAIDLRLGGPPVELRAARVSFDRAYVALVLQQSGGSVSGAAKALGLNRTHLSEMLGRLGLRKG